jgi:nitrogen-specific signal transduction histidine kinase
MNSEMNTNEASGSPVMETLQSVILENGEVQAMRHRLHELANVFTGVMIAAGLLSQYLEGGSLQHYATDICEGSDRGCVLVREIRSQLLAASGELEVAVSRNAIDPARVEPGIL